MSMDAEQRVDLMIAEGRKIVDEAIAIYNPLEIVSAYSGGNDSGPTSHFGATQFGAPAMNCVTATGCPETICHIRQFCKRQKIQLIEKVAPVCGPPKPRKGRPITFDAKSLPAGRWTDGESAYEEFVLNYGFPGPAQHGRMYQRLKGRSIESFVREAKQGKKRTDCVLIISGIRGDESTIRAGYQRTTSKVGSQIWVNPFYYFTAVDFELYRQEFGLARNPVKDACGISGECNCGGYAGEGEILRVEKASPSTASYLRSLQTRVHANGFPWDWGTKPPKSYLGSRRGQQMIEFERDAGDFQPMCIGCGKEKRIA